MRPARSDDIFPFLSQIRVNDPAIFISYLLTLFQFLLSFHSTVANGDHAIPVAKCLLVEAVVCCEWKSY